jgi:PhnB protein
MEERRLNMQFMIIVKSGKDCEAGRKPSDEVLAAVGNYTQELRRAGVLVELSRLEASSKGARIKFSGGKPLVIDGPFAETKELIGGYWIIQVKSKEEAIQWAKRVPALVSSGDECEIELRQFLEVEYFIPNFGFHGPAKPTSELAKIKTQAQ